MKNFLKYAAIGLAGYFIGFYEMKYKTLRSLIELQNKRESDDSSKEDEKEES